MFLISPKLTGLMAVVVTAVVTAGSAFGSVLRQLSRTSQAQVSSALCHSWRWCESDSLTAVICCCYNCYHSLYCHFFHPVFNFLLSSHYVWLCFFPLERRSSFWKVFQTGINHYLLHLYLPERCELAYSLWFHNKYLIAKTTELNEWHFLVRTLYKHIYWTLTLHVYIDRFVRL